MKLLTETYAKRISFTLGCFDRLLITGTLPEICHSKGMTSYMYKKSIRIFDYAKHVEQYREALRQNAEQIALENGCAIEFIRKSTIRKEDIIQKRLKERGYGVGIVHIISAMETCST